MDQSGKVVNLARGQLNRENEYFPLPVRACSFSILRLNLVLTHGIPPDFRGGVNLFIPSYAIGSVPSLLGNAIACRWRSLPRFRRHRASIVLRDKKGKKLCSLCFILLYRCIEQRGNNLYSKRYFFFVHSIAIFRRFDTDTRCERII